MSVTFALAPPLESLNAHSLCNEPQQPAYDAGHFAFARIQDEVYLVQVSLSTPLSPLTTVDVKIFRHEFVTIFRLSEEKTLHPADICILEHIDDQMTRYEEDSETVFLARDLMAHLRRMSDRRAAFNSRRRHPGLIGGYRKI